MDYAESKLSNMTTANLLDDEYSLCGLTIMNSIYYYGTYVVASDAMENLHNIRNSIFISN